MCVCMKDSAHHCLEVMFPPLPDSISPSLQNNKTAHSFRNTISLCTQLSVLTNTHTHTHTNKHTHTHIHKHSQSNQYLRKTLKIYLIDILLGLFPILE